MPGRIRQTAWVIPSSWAFLAAKLSLAPLRGLYDLLGSRGSFPWHSLCSTQGMSRSTWLSAAVLLTCIGSLAAVADALVVTEEERIEEFVDALSGEVSTDAVDDALAFVDTDRVPLTLRTERRRERFEEGDSADLAELARDALRPLQGTDTTLIQSDVRVEGEIAFAAVRVRTERGLVDANFEFEKASGRWLLSEAYIR